MAFGESLNEQSPADAARAIKVLARTMVRELKRGGFSQRQMVTFTSELLGLVTAEIKSDEPSDHD